MVNAVAEEMNTVVAVSVIRCNLVDVWLSGINFIGFVNVL